MVSRVQNIRSTTKNTRPPNSTRQPGEFFVNFADKQFGVIDTAQVPQDLIAIRFHSSLTDYAIGDHVIYQGKAYRAKQVIPAGNFNPAFWETAGMADAPADNKLYGRINNTWDLPEIGDILLLQGALDAKAPLVSPALAGTPTAPTAAAATNSSQLATTAFVKGQNYAAIGGPELLARVAKVGDTMTGPLTLPADPTVPLHAATKQYVDNKPSGASTIDTPPGSAVNGQLWWETDTGGLFVRYDDGSSQQWVQLNGEMGNAVQRTGDTMTGNLTVGDGTTSKYLIVNGGNSGNGSGGAIIARNSSITSMAIGSKSAILGGPFDATSFLYGNGKIEVYDQSPFFIANNAPSTSPTTGALTVAGGVGIGGTVYAAASWLARSGTAGAMLYTNDTDATATSQMAVLFLRAGAGAGSITTTNNTVSYNTSSSAELKEDLQSFDAGRIVDDTEVYDFKWKDTEVRAYGVVAQQAVEVYPQAIFHDEKEDWWGVDYSKYVPVILQELKALRARVAELEGEKAPIAPKKRS